MGVKARRGGETGRPPPAAGWEGERGNIMLISGQRAHPSPVLRSPQRCVWAAAEQGKGMSVIPAPPRRGRASASRVAAAEGAAASQLKKEGWDELWWGFGAGGRREAGHPTPAEPAPCRVGSSGGEGVVPAPSSPPRPHPPQRSPTA
eukprot:TRINITY_DN2781_c0_g1_i1.p3 TRINITY_DN2781_c0_g1~~TRINITY_DN2781_c0_g1_i1.p3  ORF type:complete len:147 (-),score=5.41 TRINITY_DN2781_c0_g1_i1:171-611(-)